MTVTPVQKAIMRRWERRRTQFSAPNLAGFDAELREADAKDKPAKGDAHAKNDAHA